MKNSIARLLTAPRAFSLPLDSPQRGDSEPQPKKGLFSSYIGVRQDSPVEHSPEYSRSRSPDGEETDHSSHGTHRLWVPRVLRRRAMVAFVSVFAALLSVLIALYVYSKVDNGIDAEEDKNYYVWTYGPTAGSH